MNTLLNRDQFKEVVFKRNGYKCVVCGKQAQDAYHIIDRSLWDNGGYYANNGVSLCEEHHIQAEQTIISCKKLREMSEISEKVYPEHFYIEEEYDHWGNIVKPDGTRIKGELYNNDNVQKILPKHIKDYFLNYIKYPRTYHVPYSENLQNDDKMHDNIDFFIGKEVVVSVKLDGENSSLYSNYIHARSVDSKHHESRDWIKSFHAKIKHEIPENWRFCGENLYAEHSIRYNNLDSYFYLFNIWNENNEALSWDDTVEYANMLNINIVPEIYRGVWDKDKIHDAYLNYCSKSPDPVEGYVIRITDKIPYRDYRRCTAKFVRKSHVTTDQHWMTKKVVRNGLKNS